MEARERAIIVTALLNIDIFQPKAEIALLLDK